MKHVTEELVYTTTDDGLEHAGVLLRAADSTQTPVPIVWVHGAGANFYMRPYVLLARALAQRGYTVLLGNTRGHDFGYFLGFDNQQPRYAGQGWEYFHQSPYDIAGWITFLEQQGFARVILGGHSLGAAKVVYYQAQRQDHRVHGVVSASAPAALAQHDGATPSGSSADGARRSRTRFTAMGQSAGGGTLSAQAYYDRGSSQLDLYGRDTTLPPIAKIVCPLLALYGTDEGFVGGKDDLARAKAYADARAGIATALIEGADHVYAGYEAEVARTIDTWIQNISSNARKVVSISAMHWSRRP